MLERDLSNLSPAAKFSIFVTEFTNMLIFAGELVVRDACIGCYGGILALRSNRYPNPEQSFGRLVNELGIHDQLLATPLPNTAEWREVDGGGIGFSDCSTYMDVIQCVGSVIFNEALPDWRGQPWTSFKSVISS